MSEPAIVDERQGRPSASGMERIALCPGSWLAEQASPPSKPSKYAAAGTRIAAYIEAHFKHAPKPKDCTGEEETAALRMIADTALAYEEMRRQFPGMPLRTDTGSNLIMSESRLWSPSKSRIPYSGKADIIVVNESQKWCLIVDHKSGWLPVEVPTHNWQLRTLAVLAWNNFGVDTVCVAIAQPNHGPPKLAVYDKAVLIAAESTIDDALARAFDADAKRIPNTKACRYCRARPNCSEARRVLVNVSTNTGIPDDLSLALEMVEVAEMVADDIRTAAKTLLAEKPDAIPGWGLRPGNTRHTVTDTAGAFAKVKDVVTPPEFTSCCSVKFGELTKVFAKKSGLNQKAGKEALIVRLAETLETSQNQPSLVRVEIKPPSADE